MKGAGPQYEPDDPFKAAARLHQSNYRSRILKADWSEYGNRLADADGRSLLNYYDSLGVREALRKRYPRYSKRRDADMLRSEHIPFNMFAPLVGRSDLAREVLNGAFGIELETPFRIEFEWAPSPAGVYLSDMTSFDTYIEGTNKNRELVGVGIEVKYTEQAYAIGEVEARRVKDRTSQYWNITRESGLFVENGCDDLAEDGLRQIWRNHLLGLSMMRNKDIAHFISVTLYPSGNKHFTHAMERYRSHLAPDQQASVRGCTFEQYIDSIQGDSSIRVWKEFLKARYIVRSAE